MTNKMKNKLINMTSISKGHKSGPRFIFLLLASLFILLLAAGGCDKSVNNGNGSPNGGDTSINGTQGNTGTEGQIGSSSQDSSTTIETASTATTQTVLYFANGNADKLVAEKRTVNKTPKIASETLNELIKGPENKELYATIPEGTVLLGLEIKNSVATVNFSSELRDDHPGGSAGELMTVYSIVNTLTEFPTVKSVQILIEGNKIDTLAGHMDLSTPLTRDEDIIQK